MRVGGNSVVPHDVQLSIGYSVYGRSIHQTHGHSHHQQLHLLLSTSHQFDFHPIHPIHLILVPIPTAAPPKQVPSIIPSTPMQAPPEVNMEGRPQYWLEASKKGEMWLFCREGALAETIGGCKVGMQ